MYKELMENLNKYGMFFTATVVKGEYISSKISFDDKGNILKLFGSANSEFWSKYLNEILYSKETRLIETIDTSIVVEKTSDIPRMVILGGGHVSYNLAYIAKGMGFYTLVIDDRKEFANKERFECADEIMCSDYESAFDKIEDTYNTYYVIVTRGHAFDSLCLEKALQRECAYIGMIGSKSKVATVLNDLLNKGYDKEKTDEVHSPIGLKLGGNLPMEVAVSIAAEITQIRNSKKTSVMDSEIKKYFLEGKEQPGDIMTTIIEKKGSSPRGLGSKMLIKKDGTILGSIGGGSIEFEAINYGKNLTKPETQKYDLSNNEGAKLGMTCGGHVTVFYEVI